VLPKNRPEQFNIVRKYSKASNRIKVANKKEGFALKIKKRNWILHNPQIKRSGIAQYQSKSGIIQWRNEINFFSR
jgi:hypothetical protein